MKALISLIAVLLLGGGYYVFVVLPGSAPPSEPAGPPAAGAPAAGGRADDGALPRPKPVTTRPSKPAVDKEAKRIARWTRFRPSQERLIPDPDHVGPCPPVDIGGMPAPVIRRFRDPDNGFATWVHADGSYTIYHTTGSVKDPVTGKIVPKMMVSSFQPAEPKPISPDDLPDSAAQGAGTKTGGGAAKKKGG